MEIKPSNNSDTIKNDTTSLINDITYSRLGLRVQKREHVITACSVKDSIKSSVHICDKKAKHWRCYSQFSDLEICIAIKRSIISD